MTKTYTLAEILTDHMDAVQEGRVRTKGGMYLRFLDGLRVIGWSGVRPPAFASSHTQAPSIDGYTIEPKKVQVPTALRDLMSCDDGIVSIEAYKALLRIARAAKAWQEASRHYKYTERIDDLRAAIDAVELEDGDE